MKDMSLRVYEALTMVDIIACEDTRMAGKLFTQMKEKKLGELYNETWSESNASILSGNSKIDKYKIRF